jgi:malonate transporter
MSALLNIVLPIFAIVVAGFVCGRYNLLGPESSEALNRFVYWVALPALLFKAMASVNLAVVFNWAFIGGFTSALFVLWIFASTVGRLLFRLNPAESALHGLNGVYANTGYMGIPLALAAYGDDAGLPAILATVISVMSVALAIVPIEISRSRTTNLFQLLTQVVRALICNPMIVAPVVGLIWASTNFALAAPVETFVNILGAAAGPCALFAIGLYLVGKPVVEGTTEIATITLIKLVLHPALTAIAVLFIFPTEPLWAAVAVLCAALPIGSGPFVLAQAQNIYVRRTSTAMLATTALSIATVSIVLILFPPTT